MKQGIDGGKVMKKVLILTASTGEGHNTAAKSLEDKYIEAGFKTYRVDIFKETSSTVNVMMADGYRVLANSFPTLYGLLYDTFDRASFNRRILGNALFVIKQRVLGIVREVNPDLIVSTHPFAVGIVASLKKKGKIDCAFISVVTDFKAHYAYVDPHVDAYITGSEYTNETLMERSIPEDKVFAYGIPIKKEFLSEETFKYSSTDMWNTPLDMDGDFKVLVMGGSMGSKDIAKVVEQLAVESDRFEITVVCGNNKSLRNMLEKRYQGPVESGKLIIYGFTDKIPQLMDVCDVIVTKPGGLTTSEAIAKNIPMIIPFAIPGQEMENTEFLVNAGIAIHVKDMEEINECLEYLIENRDVYLEMKNRMQEISSNYSIDKIVNLSESLILDEGILV